MKNRMPTKPLAPCAIPLPLNTGILCLLMATCLLLPGCLRERYDTSIPYSKFGYDLSFKARRNLLLEDSWYHYSTGHEKKWRRIDTSGAGVDNTIRKFGILSLRLKMSDGRTYNEEIDLLPLVENMKKNNNIYDILFGPMEEIITKQYDDHVRKYGFSWYAITWREVDRAGPNYAPPPI